MTRLAAALVFMLVAFAGFGVGTAAAYFEPYAGPGESFSPGEGHGSVYDHACGRWAENFFNKAPSALGLMTFIDPSGNWSNGAQGYGGLYRKLTNPIWSKKLHCKNTSGSTYAAGCYGNRVSYQCA
jgi:hypothetical protein